jgi:rubrerythrin
MWLTHDPADFGLAAIVPPPPAALAGSMRTGLTEALLTDAEDDSYDLSWLHRLPSDALAAVRELRRLRHNAEMDGIRAALLAKFGKVPVLETYRQMAIRRQKAKDWQQAIWWVERGLALYGEQAARPESVDDLRKRLIAYQAKLTTPTKPPRKAAPNPHAERANQTIEVLVCETCGVSFDRVVVRGRKPKNCPGCRRPERTAGGVAS